jgi:hypothetical protein
MNFGASGEFFAGSGAGGGAAFRFTFLETYKDYGTFFLIPNLFFVEGGYTRFGNNDHYGQSVNAGRVSAGFLYHIRLGEGQRFMFGLGAAVGPIVSQFNWNTKYDDEADLLPSAAVGFYADLPYAELSFRFTPAWSLGLGLGFSGDLSTLAADTSGIMGFRGCLGLSYRRPR